MSALCSRRQACGLHAPDRPTTGCSRPQICATAPVVVAPFLGNPKVPASLPRMGFQPFKDDPARSSGNRHDARRLSRRARACNEAPILPPGTMLRRRSSRQCPSTRNSLVAGRASRCRPVTPMTLWFHIGDCTCPELLSKLSVKEQRTSALDCPTMLRPAFLPASSGDPDIETSPDPDRSRLDRRCAGRARSSFSEIPRGRKSRCAGTGEQLARLSDPTLVDLLFAGSQRPSRNTGSVTTLDAQLGHERPLAIFRHAIPTAETWRAPEPGPMKRWANPLRPSLVRLSGKSLLVPSNFCR